MKKIELLNEIERIINDPNNIILGHSYMIGVITSLIKFEKIRIEVEQESFNN